MEYGGGCLCKAVRYKMAAEPITARTCWCRLCQYIGAGSATVNVGFPSAKATIEGKLGDYVSTADSGNIMHRRFCLACGTHIFSETEVRPHLIFVRAGTLDTPQIAKPEMTIWTSRAPAWAVFDESIPKFAEQPAAISQPYKP